MATSKQTSAVQLINAPQTQVYRVLSNMSVLKLFQSYLNENDPNLRSKFLERMDNNELSAENIDRIVEIFKNMEISDDEISIKSDYGTFGIAVVERDEPKCIKYISKNAPLEATAWIQLLPKDDNQSLLKLTVSVEANFMMKFMVSKALAKHIDKVAQVFTQIPYGLLDQVLDTAAEIENQ